MTVGKRSSRTKQSKPRGKRGSIEAAVAPEAASQQAAAPPEALLDDMQLSVAKAYDDFPYEGSSFPLTHPERLATIAILFGQQPPPATAARVLELGCGMGGNLVPMAHSMPGASFVGYDLSGVHIRHAQEIIRGLDLKNVRVEQRNLLDVGKETGKFDYIICHGVYSWVPANVQDKILSICRENLNENGVALVSYNTYPGWHMRDSIRGMMRYHARQFTDPKVQVAQARALLDFLVQSVDSEKNPYGMHLASELKLLSGTADSYIAHEHLERWNTPVYFYEFTEHVGRHGLQYLGDSEFATMVVKNFTKPVADRLSQGISDAIRMEQYMDFIRNRTFRSTLLCHRECRVDRNVDNSRVTRLYAAAGVEPVDAQTDLLSGQPEKFKTHNGIQFEAAIAMTRAALRVLSAAWPGSVAFEDLLAGARRLISAIRGASAVPAGEQQLAADLLQLYAANAIELHSVPSSFVTSVSERPCTTALVRLQASQGTRLTNLRHESLRVNDVERQLLLLLDGTLGRPEVLERMMGGVAAGQLLLKRGEQPITDPRDSREQLGRFYDQLLPLLGRKALLAA